MQEQPVTIALTLTQDQIRHLHLLIEKEKKQATGQKLSYLMALAATLRDCEKLPLAFVQKERLKSRLWAIGIDLVE